MRPNCRLTIPTFAEPLVNGTASGAFDREGIEIAAARFEDGQGGVIEAHGRVSLVNLRPVDYAIELRAREYHYAGEENGIRGVGPGGFIVTDGWAFITRIDLSASPGFGKTYRSQRSSVDSATSGSPS